MSAADVLPGLLADLEAESAWLIGVLDGLDDEQWERVTPAPGWTVHDQVGHLAYFDEACTEALLEPDRFAVRREALLALGSDFPDRVAEGLRGRSHADLDAWLRRSRSALLTGFAGADPATRLPWFGPDMGAVSAATARLMETWAHGRDIADAVGVVQPATDRLRHVADLGVRTRGFSYAVRGLTPPDVTMRVELDAPAGGTWVWGAQDAVARITGRAEDFCLVVTQRRHPHDTALVVDGPAAREWLDIAQAFAGAASAGPAPLARG